MLQSRRGFLIGELPVMQPTKTRSRLHQRTNDHGGVRQAEGRIERIPEVAAELIGLKVDVLVTATSPGALAAKKATSTIPIVMLAADPVGLDWWPVWRGPEGT